MASPKYKSGLEVKVAKLIGKQAKYETTRFPYTVVHNYCPDFDLGNGKYIEVKGKWVASDRAKHKYIKEQHPEIKVFFIFGNASNKLNRASRTTYGEWATKNGFEWVGIKDFNKEVLDKWKE